MTETLSSSLFAVARSLLAVAPSLFAPARSLFCKQPGHSFKQLALHQRTPTLLLRPERFVRRDGVAQPVVVVRRFRLAGLLHFEQVHRVDLAAVLADVAFA